jgi:hypothetical protein
MSKANANTIREACFYESRFLADTGMRGASEALHTFARQATDEELIRFADLISNVTQPVDYSAPTDSADLARLNID